MTGLDCNILVQPALADHPENAATPVAMLHATGVRRLLTPNPRIWRFSVFLKRNCSGQLRIGTLIHADKR
jgi:hypothetical protein